MEATQLPRVQSVHREMVRPGVMEIANGSKDNVNQKVCNPLFLTEEAYSHGIKDFQAFRVGRVDPAQKLESLYMAWPECIIAMGFSAMFTFQIDNTKR